MSTLNIYTDGSCHTSTGVGGYAGIFTVKDQVIATLSGQVSDTTSNRMELLAVLKSWYYVEDNKLPFLKINIYTDSQYVYNGYRIWLTNWIRKGWMTSNKTPVKNRDLWEEMIPLLTESRLTIYWVKGHADNGFNNAADVLANKSRVGSID
jgi:ribonuclease HI